MGCFSWMYADEPERSMRIDEHKDSFLLVPQAFQVKYGAYIKETCYSGYGRMGGYDIYDLVSEWNREFIPEVIRRIEAGTWHSARKPDIPMLQAYHDGNMAYFSDPDNRAEVRYVGIALACDSRDNAELMYPVKITTSPMEYGEAEPSSKDPDQGF